MSPARIRLCFVLFSLSLLADGLFAAPPTSAESEQSRTYSPDEIAQLEERLNEKLGNRPYIQRNVVFENGELRAISLHHGDFTDENVALFCPSDSLVEFRAQCGFIKEESLRRILASPNLEILRIQTFLKLDETSLRQIGQLKQLKHLRISHTELDLAALKWLQSLKSLQSLAFHGTNVDDKSLATLRELPLVELGVSANRITADGLKTFKGHPTLKTIFVDERFAMPADAEQHLAPIQVSRTKYEPHKVTALDRALPLPKAEGENLKQQPR